MFCACNMENYKQTRRHIHALHAYAAERIQVRMSVARHCRRCAKSHVATPLCLCGLFFARLKSSKTKSKTATNSVKTHLSHGISFHEADAEELSNSKVQVPDWLVPDSFAFGFVCFFCYHVRGKISVEMKLISLKFLNPTRLGWLPFCCIPRAIAMQFYSIKAKEYTHSHTNIDTL